MSVLSQATVERLRRFIARSFSATVSVQEQVRAQGVGGVVTATWSTITTVPGSFRPAAAPSEVVGADAARAVTRYVVKLPAGTGVKSSHRLVVTHAEPGVPSPLTMSVIGPFLRTGEITRSVLAEVVG